MLSAEGLERDACARKGRPSGGRRLCHLAGGRFSPFLYDGALRRVQSGDGAPSHGPCSVLAVPSLFCLLRGAQRASQGDLTVTHSQRRWRVPGPGRGALFTERERQGVIMLNIYLHTRAYLLGGDLTPSPPAGPPFLHLWHRTGLFLMAWGHQRSGLSFRKATVAVEPRHMGGVESMQAVEPSSSRARHGLLGWGGSVHGPV